MIEKIGRYNVKGLLGRGGMAAVYSAFDPEFNREVAIKILPKEFLHDPEFRQRFRREAMTIARLEHPAIVPVYDFGEEEGQPYLVMRLMSGGSLAQKIQNGPISLTDTARLFEVITPALDAAHAQGLVHRDIKPANILFDQWGSPYISDFGIVKLVSQSEEALTRTGGLVGSPAYMSPEQVTAQTELDGRSDIYALGCILFEMLTGSAPYQANTPIGVAFMHVNQPVPRILTINDALPDGCDAIIEKAMAKDRNVRYSKATLLSGDLSSLVNGTSGSRLLESSRISQGSDAIPGHEPPLEPNDATIIGNTKAKRFSPWLVGIAAVLVGFCLLTLTVGYYVYQQFSPSDPEIVLVTTSEGAETPTRPTQPTDIPTVATFPPQTVTSVPTKAPSSTPTPTNTATVVPTDTPDLRIAPLEAELNDEWRRPIDESVMVYVPGGTFQMGTAGEVPDWRIDQQPQHEVRLSAFWLDRTEITNTQFSIFVDKTGYLTGNELSGAGRVWDGERWAVVEGANWQHPEGPLSTLEELMDHPVVHVTWEDASAYCNWAGGMLPTEAQWEYAARGQDGNEFTWGSEFDSGLVNYCDSNCRSVNADAANSDGYATTSPVSAFESGASWVGAINMLGNVWEWVHDLYDPEYYARSPLDNPQGPDSGDRHVLRGGAWITPSNALFVTTRGKNVDTLGSFGFRCVVEPGNITP
ncbi:MAG: SUMF1/EgtB/PvdO family nonheme iron enzyme [Anaerolineales bacterium]|nr:SUMF1/EgtB/PvdO family nonheme iron enzyme [Anaerolineales bacterium]